MSLSRINTTGYKGVSLEKTSGRYTAFIRCNYKHIFGGRFKTAIDAAKKYNEMALKYHGDFARLNQIPNE